MQANTLINHIPNVLSAKSLRGLRRLMLINNGKHGAYVRYFDFQYVNERWHCFYIVNDDRADELLEVGDDE